MHHFSTDSLPERDRLAFLHDVVARHVAGRQFRPIGSDIRVTIAAFGLPDQVTIGKAQYSPIRGTRTRELTGDGRDNYLLTIHRDEHEIVVENRQPIKVPAGSLMIVNEGTWSEFRLPATALTVVSLKRKRLSRLVPRIEREASYQLPAGAAGLALAMGYADLLHSAPPGGDRARQTASDHLYDLAALLLDGFFTGGTGWRSTGVRAARLELVKRDIKARLADTEFAIAAVARRLGITPRYIQRLFEGEGTSFSKFLRESRLELAYSLLLAMPENGGSISAIAFDAGFADLSSFNRSFRRRYGVTPSDIRAEAMRRR